jgi:hypothetical protein
VRRALLVSCLAAAAWADEPRAFLETKVEREACWVGEAVRVRLRVGIDRAFFEKSSVQMFQQRLDLPVHIEAPWLAELAKRGGDALSLALNDAIIDAAREPDSRGFTVVEIAGTLRPDSPGELVLAAPRLRFAYATRFRENLVYGRIPVDRRDGLVTGPRVVLDVRALPPAPDGFDGAIGRFRVQADAQPREVDAGVVFKLTLTVTGDGNLDRMGTPRLELPGFHVYGAVNDHAGTIVYDVAAVGAAEAVEAVPPIAFVSFDPAAGAYATVRTEPIPISVRGAPKSSRAPARAPGWPVWPWLVVVVLGAGLVVRIVRARKREDAPDAAALFRARAPSDDLADVLAAYLAARLQCPKASVIAPDLPTRLAAAGVPDELASRTAGLLERLVGARYGGGAADATDQATANKLVEELERA